MFDISIYCGHNSSVTISKDGNVLEVVELERLVNIKNSGLLWYIPVYEPFKILEYILQYFKQKYRATSFEHLICNQDDTRTLTSRLKSEQGILKFFSAKKLIEVFHQDGHAACGFYQSNLQNAVIISIDGGGNDGCYNYYTADRNDGVKLIGKNLEYNIGEKYAELGHHCASIRKEEWLKAYLVYAGKLMGLAGYGKIQDEYIAPLHNFYLGHHSNKKLRDENYNKLKQELNLPDTLSDSIERDLIRTSQEVFEQIFESTTRDIVNLANDNLILTGGCALNILNNTRVNSKVKTFIPPNPNDSGLSLGFMLHHLKPQNQFDGTYTGPEVWDKMALPEYLHANRAESNTIRVVDDLVSGKIIGVVNGRSEIGPRALGNRSILCYPAIEGMKDTLNSKVKNREYYRPFAPVVRLEDINKYFEFNQESKWMSFSPKVKTEFKDTLQAITHVDGTARVQTVTEEQNPFLYELLSLLDSKTGIGVLLNTSFNVAGKPILNTYRDALWMLSNTELDGVILEKFYIWK